MHSKGYLTIARCLLILDWLLQNVTDNWLLFLAIWWHKWMLFVHFGSLAHNEVFGSCSASFKPYFLNRQPKIGRVPSLKAFFSPQEERDAIDLGDFFWTDKDFFSDSTWVQAIKMMTYTYFKSLKINLMGKLVSLRDVYCYFGSSITSLNHNFGNNFY